MLLDTRNKNIYGLGLGISKVSRKKNIYGLGEGISIVFEIFSNFPFLGGGGVDPRGHI
jgi:hypothetical protein